MTIQLALSATDPFGSLGRPFALACEIPPGAKCFAWGKHPLECVEQGATSTTFRSLTLGSMIPTARASIVFAHDVEPPDALPESVAWGTTRLTHHKGNELAVYTAGVEAPERADLSAFLRAFDGYWQDRVSAEEAQAGEMALLAGIYAAVGVPMPVREPKSMAVALKRLTLSAVKGATGLTKPMLDFIEKHDERPSLVGWCGGAKAKLAAAGAMAALRGPAEPAEPLYDERDPPHDEDDGSEFVVWPDAVMPDPDPNSSTPVPSATPVTSAASASQNGSVRTEPVACNCIALVSSDPFGLDDDRDGDECVNCGHASSAHDVRGICTVRGEMLSLPQSPAAAQAPVESSPLPPAIQAHSGMTPAVWIVEVETNVKTLKGRVFRLGHKNLIYGLNKQGKTALVTAIRLALGQEAPEFGVHESRAMRSDLFNLRAPGEDKARVRLKFNDGTSFMWALDSAGNITTRGTLPAVTYALDGVEEAVTGNSTGMLRLLDSAGVEIVPRTYIEKVLGTHLPTLARVITDDSATKLSGDTVLDQLVRAYGNGLQLVRSGHKALKDAKTRRAKGLKEAESISHQNSLGMDNLAGQMEALAPVLGYPGLKFAAFFTDDAQRAAVMTDVAAKAASATKVDKQALANRLNQQEYVLTGARGNLERAEARLGALVQEGQALKQATMANPLPEAEPTARELELANAFVSLFDFGEVMTAGRAGAIACPVCNTNGTVEAIREHMAKLAESPIAARFKVIRSYGRIAKIHADYKAKGDEYKHQRNVTIVGCKEAVAKAENDVATTKAQITAAESNVNPIAVSAESFVTAFGRYRELFVANRDGAKSRDAETAFIAGPLTQAIQAFQIATDSLRSYTVDRLRGLIAEHTGNDNIAIDVHGRNVVVGAYAPGHDNGIMLGTSRSQTFQLIGNICAMLYGSQELAARTLYLAETGDVAWTEPHLSETLSGWANNSLQWLVQSTVKPVLMPEGWTLVDLSVGA